MKKLSYQKQVNAKKLTKELQAAFINVVSVEIEIINDVFSATLVFVDDETEEDVVDAIVEAHNTTPEIDLLKNDTRQWLLNNTQLRQLVNASNQQIKNAVANMTQLQKDEALVFLLILAKIQIKREL